MRCELSGLVSEFIGHIDPERGPEGEIVPFMPQERYRNLRSLPLNANGSGPFCRFSIAREVHASGIYAITLKENVVYVGKCQDLAERFGPRGYGVIHPRNCFRGGQSTNCKVNHLILEHADPPGALGLWFHASTEPASVEREVIVTLAPAWNDQVPW